VADFLGDGPFAYLGWGMEIAKLIAGVNASSLFVYILRKFRNIRAIFVM
jgi:hypothetical protein